MSTHTISNNCMCQCWHLSYHGSIVNPGASCTTGIDPGFRKQVFLNSWDYLVPMTEGSGEGRIRDLLVSA